MLVLLLALFAVLSESSGAAGHGRLRVQEEVVAVRLTGVEGMQVSIEKDEEGRWFLNGEFRANELAVRDMLSALRNLEVRRPVPVAEMEAVTGQLDETGTGVEVFGKGHWIPLPGDRGLFPRQRKLRHFVIGEDSHDGGGSFLRLRGENDPLEAYVPGAGGGLKKVFTPQEHIWRDPVVLDLEPSEIIRVRAVFSAFSGFSAFSAGEEGLASEQAAPGESHASDYSGEEGFVLEQSDPGVYHLFDHFDHTGAEIDISRLRSERLHRYLNAFSGLYYERLLPGTADDPPGDMWSENPAARIYVTDHTGLETGLYFFRRQTPDDGSLLSEYRDYDPNRFYLQVNRGDFALAQYYVFHPIKRTLSFFLEEESR